MELLPIIRLLWRRRWLLGLGTLLSIGLLVGLGGTKPVMSTGALAWTRVALDTPRSQLVDSAPAGADTLAWRASLLAHLLSTHESRNQIARRLGVTPEEVNVIDAALATPKAPASMPSEAAEAAGATWAPYTVTVALKNGSLPVISLEAATAERESAKQLAEAAVAVLESQASAGGPFSSLIPTGAKVFKLQPYVISQVAPVRVEMVSKPEPPLKAIGAAGFFFITWWGAVLLAPLLLSRRGGPGRIAAAA